MPSSRPMPIAPMPVSDLPDELRQYAEGQLGEAWFGFLAKAGPLAELFTPYYAALTGSTNVLGFKLAEMVRLAIATTTGCEACLSLRDPRPCRRYGPGRHHALRRARPGGLHRT
jgi:hypothetical protein